MAQEVSALVVVSTAALACVLAPENVYHKRHETRQCEERSDEVEPRIKIGVPRRELAASHHIANTALHGKWQALRGGDFNPGHVKHSIHLHDATTWTSTEFCQLLRRERSIKQTAPFLQDKIPNS